MERNQPIERKTRLTYKDKLFQMLKKQLNEDITILKKFDTNYLEAIYNNSYFFPLLNKLGELGRLIQRPDAASRSAIAEKFIDVTHLILSFHLANTENLDPTLESDDFIEFALLESPKSETDIGFGVYVSDSNAVQVYMTKVLEIAGDMDYEWMNVLDYWICLYKELGLRFKEDIYEPFMRENKGSESNVC